MEDKSFTDKKVRKLQNTSGSHDGDMAGDGQ